jgi:hypothetical protein
VITLTPNTTNTFVIYVDTIDNEVQTYGDYFLFGFENGFTREWTYVVPTVLTRNTRYIKFEITVTPNEVDYPLDGSVYLAPSGNWDYKLWNTATATLNPASGNLLDEGQMSLEDLSPAEVTFTPYVSNNESLSSYVYYSANGVWNTTQNVWDAYQKLWQQA